MRNILSRPRRRLQRIASLRATIAEFGYFDAEFARSSTASTSWRTTIRSALTDEQMSAEMAELRAEIREEAAPQRAVRGGADHPDMERRRDARRACDKEDLDHLRGHAGRRAARGLRGGPRDRSPEAGHASLRCAAHGWHRPPPGEDRRAEDGRGQDARGTARRRSERDVGARGPHRDRQRLPGQTRPTVDGTHLPRPGADGRRDPA